VVDFFDRKSLFFDKSPKSFDKERFCFDKSLKSFDKERFCFDKSSKSFDKEQFCFDKSSKYSYKTNERSFSDSVLGLDTKIFTKITLIILFFNTKKRVVSCVETTLFWLFGKKRGIDFRPDWALCCCRFAFAQSKASSGRPLSRFTRDPSSRASSVTLSSRSRPTGTRINLHGIRFNKCHPQLLVISPISLDNSNYYEMI